MIDIARIVFSMKQTHQIILGLLFFIASVSSSNAQTKQDSPGWHKKTIQTKTITRHYRYYLPQTFNANQPLVILLHGGTQSMDKLFKKHAGGANRWLALAEEKGFALMVPNGINVKTGKGSGNKQNWNDCRASSKSDRYHSEENDVKFINQLIDWSKNNLSINPSQVFITGASNGGMMSYRMAIESGGKITATAAFIANMPVNNECLVTTKSVPILIFNSTKDPIMPWSGGTIKGNGGEVVSAQQTFEYWQSVNNSHNVASTNIQFNNINKKDHSSVSGRCYAANKKLKNSAKTCFYKTIGGGHISPSIEGSVPKWLQKTLLGWQNKDVEGADIAWEFFAQYVNHE